MAKGLRKARLTAIAETGGTPHAIMLWGGHASLAEIEYYTHAAKMQRLDSQEQNETLYHDQV